MKKTIEDYAIQAMAELINGIDFLHLEGRYEKSDIENGTHFSIGNSEPMPVSSARGLGKSKNINYHTEIPREQRVAKQAFIYAKAMMDEQEKCQNSK